MILKELKDYVQTRQQVSLRDLSIHFDVEPEALKGMLEFWISRGKIKHYASSDVCGGSCSCSQKDNNDIYEWNQQLGNISIEIN